MELNKKVMVALAILLTVSYGLGFHGYNVETVKVWLLQEFPFLVVPNLAHKWLLNLFIYSREIF